MLNPRPRPRLTSSHPGTIMRVATPSPINAWFTSPNILVFTVAESTATATGDGTAGVVIYCESPIRKRPLNAAGPWEKLCPTNSFPLSSNSEARTGWPGLPAMTR